MEATRIIVVRHGETAWNVDARIQGQLDVGLNETGRWQARRVGEALAGEAITAVYSSDLGRAHQTAQTIAEVTGTPVVAEEGLRERSFGMFEGKTFTEIHETWPDHAQNWRKRIPEWAPPEGGESLLQLRERVTRTMQSLAARHQGEQIVWWPTAACWTPCTGSRPGRMSIRPGPGSCPTAPSIGCCGHRKALLW